MFRPSHRLLAGASSLVLILGACSSSGATPTFTYAPPASGGSASPAAPTSSAIPSPIASTAPSATPNAVLTFSPGTKAAPRIVDIKVDDQLNFNPGFIQAAMGETVTFKIHNVGKAVHEFMVGPLADAFGDKKGTPEVADIAGGKTGEVTFTFSAAGPYAFACHAAGHFEHGMAGYIEMVGPGAPTVGTKDNPRLVNLDMTDTLKFIPEQVTAALGESIRFVLTNSGKAEHEFQVGPADKVAADEHDGVIVVEKDKLDAGSTQAVDYTFTGKVPYAFACHMPGHYEAGMKGTVAVTGS